MTAQSEAEKLLALAEKVEALTGPDREVDAGIVLALHPAAQIGEYLGYEDIVFHARPLVDDKEILPFFTSSLDAAMTLVPEDYDWAVFRTNGGITTHSWCGSQEDVFAATPVLALTAAALRARAAITTDTTP